MKTPSYNCKDLQDLRYMQRRVVYLRYGTETPSKSAKPPAYLSYPTISRLLKITVS